MNPISVLSELLEILSECIECPYASPSQSFQEGEGCTGDECLLEESDSKET